MKRVLCVFDASFLFVSSIEDLGLCINEPKDWVLIVRGRCTYVQCSRAGRGLKGHKYIERKLARSLVTEGRSGSSWGLQVRSSSDRAGGILRPGPRRKEHGSSIMCTREDSTRTEPKARRADFGSAGQRLGRMFFGVRGYRYPISSQSCGQVVSSVSGQLRAL